MILLSNKGSETSESANNIAAINALIGLMNIQMVTKLRDVFDQLFGIRKSDQDKGDEPSVAEESIKLSIESTEIEEGKDSFLIGVVKDDEGNPKKDLEVNFAIANTTYASFKENEDPRKITDSNGVAVQRFQALKKGNTLAVITAKDKDKDKDKDKELYANVPISVKSAPPPDSDASGESSGFYVHPPN